MGNRSLVDGPGASCRRLAGRAALTGALALFAFTPANAADLVAPDKAFISDHCAGCHNETDKKGRLDLTSLAYDPNDPANLATWIKVHDRAKAGEMPPRTRARPDAARQSAFVAGLAQSTVAAERAALAGEGRAVQRRLNRHEYENALRDLLGVPWAQVANRLPDDGEAYRFNKSGEALDVSYLQGSRLVRTRVNGTDEQYVNPLATEDGMPGYAMQWIEVEGPFYDDPAGEAGYRLLFDRLRLAPREQARVGVALDVGPNAAAGPAPAAGRGIRGGRGPGGFGRGGGVREALYGVESAAPRQDAGRLVRSFLKTANRRPVVEADVQRFLGLFDDQFKQGYGFAKSLLSAYTAVLCSPGFVFVEEQPGRLDDIALATPLALFLWNSTPTTRCGRWPTAANSASQTCCGHKPSGCSTTPNRGASSRRLPTTGSICGRSTTRRHRPRSTTITNSTIR